MQVVGSVLFLSSEMFGFLVQPMASSSGDAGRFGQFAALGAGSSEPALSAFAGGSRAGQLSAFGVFAGLAASTEGREESEDVLLELEGDAHSDSDGGDGIASLEEGEHIVESMLPSTPVPELADEGRHT